MYLGVSKRLIHNILKIRKDGKTPAVERQNLYAEVNNALRELGLPSEMKRGLRSVQQAKYKASEWKNVVVVAFPVLLKILIRHKLRAEAKVWIKYVYFVRALLLCDIDYHALQEDFDLDGLRANLYKDYQRTYSIGHCVSNVHQMFAHMKEQRDRLPISYMSTEDFETFYALVRKGFTPGTPQVTKQIMRNIYLYYQSLGTNHACTNRFNVKPKGRGRQDDSYLWTTTGFVRVVRVHGHRELLVRRIETCEFVVDLEPELDFTLIFVRKMVRMIPQPEVLDKADILEKAITVGDVIMSVPRTALHC